MATLNYAFVSNCAGGGHTTLDVSLNGGDTRRIVYTTDEIRQPLSEVTREEREAFALIALNLHFAGKTRVQMRNELTAPGGVTVTV